MRIGIEAQRIFRPHKFGMDIVAIELIRQLQVSDSEDEYVIFVNPDADICIRETANCKIYYIKNKIYPVWEQLLLPRAVKRAKVDMVHCTSNTAPLRLNVPLVLTLHDVISLEPGAKYFMSLYQEIGRIYRRWLIPKIVSKCSRLITVSHSEVPHICKKIPAAKGKISVIYNGLDQRFRPTDEAERKKVRNKYQLPQQYIAFLGNTDPRKNIHHVLLAYCVYLKHSRKKAPLTILHFNESRLASLLHRLKITHIAPYIRTIGYLDFEDMPGFYSASDMFLFPSLREGFGMPVLEAMACGTPVITSDASSMPEIAGGAALLADPFNVDDIALNMLHLEESPETAEELRQKGLRRSKEFSWKTMAQQVSEVYKSVSVN